MRETRVLLAMDVKRKKIEDAIIKDILDFAFMKKLDFVRLVFQLYFSRNLLKVY